MQICADRVFLKVILTATTISFAACQKDDNDTPAGDEPVFSLTVPEADRVRSNYCGVNTPSLAEDPTPAYRFESEFIDEKLKGDGLTGWIHGIVPAYGHYTFTYRKEDPNDFMAFFKAQQFSLVPMTPETRALLPTLHRHDKVRLKGSFFENDSPLPHLKITAIEVIETYPHATENTYSFDMNSLKGQKTVDVFGQVHAVVYAQDKGWGLVVEHNDALLPVAVSPVHSYDAFRLFRSDILNLSLTVAESPHSPPHFATNPAVKDAIQVVDPIINCHGQERTVEGYLIKFKKSPAILSDTYGVRVVDANGIGRNFTFFPGDHGDGMVQLFKDLGQKAKDAWESSPEEEIVVRNFHKKEGVRVSAKGIMNAVSTEQANPQVYLMSADDLTFTQTTPVTE
jgi:hypothetical protein